MSFRSLIRPATHLPRTLLRQKTASLSTSTRLLARGDGADVGPNKTHMTDKDQGHKDIQSEASKGAHDERAAGDASNSKATSEKDPGNNNERAKKDHPEAPDTVIGMNDERGGAGH